MEAISISGQVLVSMK